MKKTRVWLMGLALLVAGCEGLYQRDITAVISGPTSVAVGASVLLTVTLEYEGGDSLTLGPGDAGSITWESSNNAVATVDFFGVVTGVAPGTATITATPRSVTTDGKRTPDTHDMTVTAAAQ